MFVSFFRCQVLHFQPSRSHKKAVKKVLKFLSKGDVSKMAGEGKNYGGWYLLLDWLHGSDFWTEIFLQMDNEPLVCVLLQKKVWSSISRDLKFYNLMGGEVLWNLSTASVISKPVNGAGRSYLPSKRGTV